MKSYPNINMKQTGKKLETLVKEAGIEVKSLQAYLHLSCPQPIYRWFRGQVLPSVDHLYALSRLLGVHMEELLVQGCEEPVIHLYQADNENAREKAALRIIAYYKGLRKYCA